MRKMWCRRRIYAPGNFLGDFLEGRAATWLLTIVRNTCYTWLHQNRAHELTVVFDEEIHSGASESANPETLLLHRANQQVLRGRARGLTGSVSRSRGSARIGGLS